MMRTDDCPSVVAGKPDISEKWQSGAMTHSRHLLI
jgi:hypothetical protein